MSVSANRLHLRLMLAKIRGDRWEREREREWARWLSCEVKSFGIMAV